MADERDGVKVEGGQVVMPPREVREVLGELRALAHALEALDNGHVPGGVYGPLARMAEERIDALDAALRREG